MKLSHKIALDPTCKQVKYFMRACGTARFVWNWALAEWNRMYKAGENPTAFSLKKSFNATKYDQFQWLKNVHRDSHSQPFSNLSAAFSRFFSGKSKRPKFKKRGVARDSFYIANDQFSVKGNRIRIPKIGWVRMRESLRFDGKIMSATVSRVADRWYVSISVDGEFRCERSGDGVVGIDLGLTKTVVASDGQVFVGPKVLAKNIRKLRRLARVHSRKQKGSNNRRKCAAKLARLHARIVSVRKDWLHKTTTQLCRENQAVFVESLSVMNMMRNRKLSRAIADAGWYELVRQLAYKADLFGCVVGHVDRWFPSSKTCSSCGHIKCELKLSERTFICDACGFTADRDVNAAINIRTVGLTGINACGPEGSVVTRESDKKPCRDEAGTKQCQLVGTL